MSHIVTIAATVRDPNAVALACQRLNLPAPTHERVQLFNAEAEGLAVRLPGWRYPLVCDTAAANLHYDNYGGRWGEQRELNRFLQAYAVETAKLAARRQGRSVREHALADGSIRLTIQETA